jgi:hypothetical protein
MNMMSNKKPTRADNAAFACAAGLNIQKGLTKREYFAVMALQGLLSTPSGSSLSDYANEAVKAADELIKILNEEQK